MLCCVLAHCRTANAIGRLQRLAARVMRHNVVQARNPLWRANSVLRNQLAWATSSSDDACSDSLPRSCSSSSLGRASTCSAALSAVTAFEKFAHTNAICKHTIVSADAAAAFEVFCLHECHLRRTI